MSSPSTNAAPPTPSVSATTEAVPAVRMAAPLATLRAFSASSRSYASEAGGGGDGDGVEVFAWTSATGWDAFLGVRLNLGDAGPALGLTRGGGGGGVAAAGAGAGSSLRFHTAFDAGGSPVVTVRSSFSPTFSSFSSTGGRSKDVLVSTRAMTSSPKE